MIVRGKFAGQKSTYLGISTGLIFLTFMSPLLIGAWGIPPYPNPTRQLERQKNPTDGQAKVTQTTPANGGNEDSANRGDENEKQEKNYNGKMRMIVRWINGHEKVVIALCTVAITVFNGLLVLFTWLLWTAGERHSERELRAYVFITKAVLENFGTTTIAESTICIKNSGQTPAYKFNVVGTIALRAFPTTDFQPFRENVGKVRSEGTLGPGVEVDIVRQALRPLLPQEHAEVMRGDSAMYVFGEVTYQDAFGKDRFTRFRLLFCGNGNDPGTTLPLVVTEAGNESS